MATTTYNLAKPTVGGSENTWGTDWNNNADKIDDLLDGTLPITGIDINSGTIDGVTLGTNSAVTEAQVDNININGNTISSTDTNGNITLDPNGTGSVVIPATSTENAAIELGLARSGNGPSYIDFIGDTTYSDFGLRVGRSNTGANTNSEIAHRGTGSLVLNALDAGSILAYTSNQERLRITSSGNVGVGTSSPATKLSVIGGSIRCDDSYATGKYDIGSLGSYIGRDSSDGSTRIATAQGNIQFFTGTTTERLRIADSGNVGIGTTNPTVKLDVNGTAKVGALNIAGTAVTATAAEINTLDGINTASNFGLVPSGAILLWSGSVASVPSGWYLCDGNNGTPDLRNRFVVGAGSTYAVGATGGSADAIVVAHTHTYSGTTSTTGAHTHTYENNVNGSYNGANADLSSGGNGSNTTRNTSSAGDHSHTFSGTTASSGSSGTNANLPPYYALAYIMKA